MKSSDQTWGKKIAIGLTSTVIVSLSGCASWTHPTKSESEFFQDKLACEQQAIQMYPTIIANQLNPGYQSPSTTYCWRKRDDKDNRNTICNTTPGMYMPPSYSQNDVNASNRDEAIMSCLKAGGWRLSY